MRLSVWHVACGMWHRHTKQTKRMQKEQRYVQKWCRSNGNKLHTRMRESTLNVFQPSDFKNAPWDFSPTRHPTYFSKQCIEYMVGPHGGVVLDAPGFLNRLRESILCSIHEEQAARYIDWNHSKRVCEPNPIEFRSWRAGKLCCHIHVFEQSELVPLISAIERVVEHQITMVSKEVGDNIRTFTCELVAGQKSLATLCIYVATKAFSIKRII